MKTQYVYKVVRKARKHYYSATNHLRPIFYRVDFRIKYMLNKWSRPKKRTAGIFVFKDLFDAEEFVISRRCIILKCETKPITAIYFCPVDTRLYLTNWTEDVRALRRLAFNEHTIMHAPRGTYLSPAIKPIKELKNA